MSTSFVIPAHAGIHGSPVVAGDDDTSVIPASFVMPASPVIPAPPVIATPAVIPASFVMPAKAGIHTALFARE